MHLLQNVRDIVLDTAQAAIPEAGQLDLSAVVVEPPRDPAHGDLATNAALVLAKPLGRKPREIAETLAERLSDLPDFDAVEIAGPGFVNLRLAPGVWHAALSAALFAGDSWGRFDVGQGRKINVEYVSANPTGPLTIGHARGAVVGDALAGLLEATGHEVVREYYVNDAGGQIGKFAASLRLRLRELESGVPEEVPADLYPGAYVREIAAEAGDAGLDSHSPEADLAAFAVRAMTRRIVDDLAALGVRHDRFVSERDLIRAGALDSAQHRLEDAGLIYVGVLPPPKGKPDPDWEPRKQTLFAATAHGDDVDRPIAKADGSHTYFAADLAYHADKIARGYDELIDVMGKDHDGYVKRLKAAVSALSGGRVPLDVQLCALVNLLRDGKPVKMSKRAGTFVALSEVVEEVGADAVRLIMLSRKNGSTLDFDLEEAKRQAKDNPVYYVQYAHARCCSLARRVEEAFPGMDLSAAGLSNADLGRLRTEQDLDLLRKIACFPAAVEGAAAAREPHRLAAALQDLAAAFHQHWTRGAGDLPEQRALHPDDPEETRARAALAAGVRAALASGLRILGVSAPERMDREDQAAA